MDAVRLQELLTPGHELSDEEIVVLLGLTDPQACHALEQAAFARTTALMGEYVYFRGLIEVSNICTASCRYCGIRRENHNVKRYTMTEDEVVEAAVWAAEADYGSVCLQAGERRDEKFVAFIERCLERIHAATATPDNPEGVGITLSLGEQSLETYQRWAEAAGCPGSLRYLARFETSNPELFKVLHPQGSLREKEMEHRFRVLEDLRTAGYQVGSGVMIGIPGQTLEDLCRDIRTFQRLSLDMIGMGPYLLSEGGALNHLGQMEPKALLQLALNMIAVTRLVLGPVNIAAATALQAIRPDGREAGVQYGANIVMPNITPLCYREGYQLYKNKPGLDHSPVQIVRAIERDLNAVGRKVGWRVTGTSRKWLGEHTDFDPAKYVR